MRKKQNRILTSRLTLPLVLLVVLLRWLILLAGDYSLWQEFLLFIVNILLFRDVNHTNALVSQRGRIVLAVYAVLMSLIPETLADIHVLAVQFFVLLAIRMLFMTYQHSDSNGQKYFAYLFIGLASLLWHPIVLFVPLMLIGERYCFMSFGAKSMWACLLGLLTPYWLIMPVAVIISGLSDVMSRMLAVYDNMTHLGENFHYTNLLESYGGMPLTSLLSVLLLLVLLLIGVVHYMRNSFTDRIQVRMYYNFFMILASGVVIAGLLLPQMSLYGRSAIGYLWSVLILCATPLLSHCLSISSSRSSIVASYVITTVIAILLLTSLTTSLTTSFL